MQLSYDRWMELDPNCSIARSLGVLGERWTFLILREAISGATRFAQFRDGLRVAPDVLTARLETLVEHGVLVRAPYRDPGSRTRFEYALTPAGRDLAVVLASLMQWGDTHLPRADGPTVRLRQRGSEQALHVGFVDSEGHEVGLADARFERTPAHPAY
ncbi:MAG: transcriptional regulator [Pseudonocardiales bacterium]|nr:transcriptional regulator [Pseudonocardiales bacterium]